MRRREFIMLASGAAIAWPLAVRAQQPPRMLRLGIASASPRTAVFYATFDQRLQELGYVEGQNLIVEFRDLGDRGAYDEAVRELIRRGIDVLVVSGEEAPVKVARAATTTLPIVIVAISYDPVERGYVAGLARPGSNVTGLYFRRPELVEKQVELIAQTFPQKDQLGVLWDAHTADSFEAAERAAASLKLKLHPRKLENPPYDFITAFRSLAKAGAQTLLVLSSVYFNRDRPHIAALALRHDLPSMFISRTYVEVGGLMSYGPSITAMYRRLADYVDRIARGAKPAELPIEQPTKFELVINLKTARALDFAVTPALLTRADEVIE